MLITVRRSPISADTWDYMENEEKCLSPVIPSTKSPAAVANVTIVASHMRSSNNLHIFIFGFIEVKVEQ